MHVGIRIVPLTLILLIPIATACAEKEPPASAAKAAAPQGASSNAAPAGPSPPKSEPAGEQFAPNYRFKNGDVLYYVIESEFKDSGGVAPLLSFSTSLKDRRTIIQTVVASSQPTTRPNASPLISWECDRYEAREQGMKDDVYYDCLRHSYPPPSIRMLGGICGSTSTFRLDPRGTPDQITIKLVDVTGPVGRGAGTKTAEKAQLTVANLTELLKDMGPQFLPERPVRVGESWSRTLIDTRPNVGKITTVITCTLRGVRSAGEQRIASIDIRGVNSLERPEPTSKPTSRPGLAPATQPPKKHDFKIDRSVYNGVMEFDVARGQLVQLSLTRELSLVAPIEASSMGPMELKTSEYHRLSVRSSQKPIPKPVIVGGKKPPEIPPDSIPKPATMPSVVLQTGRPRTFPRPPVQHPTTQRRFNVPRPPSGQDTPQINEPPLGKRGPGYKPGPHNPLMPRPKTLLRPATRPTTTRPATSQAK